MGISSYSAQRTVRLAEILAEHKVPLLIHQPSYSMFNRWMDDDHLLDALDDLGIGCIAFSPLAQGSADRSLPPRDPHRVACRDRGALSADSITDERLARVRALNEIAVAVARPWPSWLSCGRLRDPRTTSLVIGPSSVRQLDDNIAALQNPSLTADELAEIARYGTDAGINLWQQSSDR